MGPWISSQVQGVNETMDLTPQHTQVQGVNGTMDFITTTGCKSDHGFDPTTDKSTGLNGSMSLTP